MRRSTASIQTLCKAELLIKRMLATRATHELHYRLGYWLMKAERLVALIERFDASHPLIALLGSGPYWELHRQIRVTRVRVGLEG